MLFINNNMSHELKKTVRLLEPDGVKTMKWIKQNQWKSGSCPNNNTLLHIKNYLNICWHCCIVVKYNNMYLTHSTNFCIMILTKRTIILFYAFGKLDNEVDY